MSSAGLSVKSAWQKAEGEMHERPWRTIALAAGAGYLVGGGIFSPLTARILGVGLRVVFSARAVPLLVKVAGEWADGLGHGENAPEPEERVKQ